MGKLADFLAGLKVVEDVESPINGKVSVIKSLAFGTYLQVSGLTQSGGIIVDIWSKTLKKIKTQKSKVKNCLILGLGGGSLVKVVKKYWPEAKIVGVDIDPVMVDLGKKYLGLDKSDVNIYIEDAYDFLIQNSKLKSKNYDLILVDLYVGDEFPKKFEDDNYIQHTRSVLASSGVVVFNRLYYGGKRRQSMKFGEKLEKIFNKVDIVFPEANVMFVCYD